MKLLGLFFFSLIFFGGAYGQTSPTQLSLDEVILSEKIEAGEYGAISSLWIEQNGETLFYQNYRGAKNDTKHNMRSVGKTVTGMLLGTAIDDGHIKNANVQASKFFKDLKPFSNPDPRKEAIQLAHLLTMSGPLECDDFNSYSRGNEERMYLVEDWSSFFWDLPIKNRPSWEIPNNWNRKDHLFSYCTAGAQLLGEIVERATQQSITEYAQSRLFEPLEITDPTWNYAATGKAHMGGGLELTTRDWASIGRLFVTNGKANGKQILSGNWIKSSMKTYVQADEMSGYGYFFWRPSYEVSGKTHKANMMSGTGGNRIYVLPEFGIVMVVTKNDYRTRNGHSTSDTLFTNEIVARLQ